MFDIGLQEILLIIFVAFMVSPKDFPTVMRKMGEFYSNIKNIKDEIIGFENEIKETLDEGLNEIKKIENNITGKKEENK